MTDERAGVQVIVQASDGRVLLQLRDDIPTIPFPGFWCVPGGMREPGEDALTCAVRELEEEMALVVEPDELELLEARERFYGHETTFLLRRDVDPAAIDLTEGQAVALFGADEIATMHLGYEDDAVLAAFFARRA
ncbi:dATP pyrophosphohydrolase [Serinibacter arcticus]|uniref:dATP pyrophosphohydrolase n=1 Tax=Serinibacter arcticus TaxID=1655435 RepID=A0A2U1ZVA0_9MICO|nr:NUDIX domain-containing protein [Serinibacter arcticus]PWD50891.1 dATP pyrophosphohydrolase [Serinibacter arcticus]